MQVGVVKACVCGACMSVSRCGQSVMYGVGMCAQSMWCRYVCKWVWSKSVCGAGM